MDIKELEDERTRLTKLLSIAKKDAKKGPEGKLRAKMNNPTPIYFYRQNPSDRNGTYIKSSDRKLAIELAQKGYAEDVIDVVQKRIKWLDKLIASYKEDNLADIYDDYCIARRKLITPYVISDEEYVLQWLEKGMQEACVTASNEDIFEKFIMGNSNDKEMRDNRVFTTAKGENVRSKSEVIIADTLARLDIPYIYEKPFYYDDGNSFKPDFTVLNVKRRKEIIIEHFGMIGSEDYMDSFFWKMKKFGKMGILQGDNLLMTFEDKEHQFNIADYIPDIKKMCLE